MMSRELGAPDGSAWRARSTMTISTSVVVMVRRIS